MKHAIHAQRRRRLLAAVPALALAAVGLTAPTAATAAASPTAVISPSEYYINYAEPAIQPDTTGKEVKGADGIYLAAEDKTRAYDKKHAAGNPLTARQLAKRIGSDRQRQRLASLELPSPRGPSVAGG